MALQIRNKFGGPLIIVLNVLISNNLIDFYDIFNSLIVVVCKYENNYIEIGREHYNGKNK